MKQLNDLEQSLLTFKHLHQVHWQKVYWGIFQELHFHPYQEQECLSGLCNHSHTHNIFRHHKCQQFKVFQRSIWHSLSYLLEDNLHSNKQSNSSDFHIQTERIVLMGIPPHRLSLCMRIHIVNLLEGLSRSLNKVPLENREFAFQELY